jgi:cellulose synthase (UDP-forming)
VGRPLAGWLLYLWQQAERLFDAPLGIGRTVETVAYVVVVTLLTASASSYLLARLGFLQQVRDHQRAPRAEIDAAIADTSPPLTVLVPSYREGPRVVCQTLLSAALQEYPEVRVVLHVDDPPHPTNPAHHALLESARNAPVEIQRLLEAPRQRAERALATFEDAAGADPFATADQLQRLADEYDIAAAWLLEQVDATTVNDHVDRFFTEQVFLRPAEDFTVTAQALREAATADAPISVERARQLHRRLAWTFRVSMSSFERKRFASLSHEANKGNKAMNLNSYIGLMGGRYLIESSPVGRVLLPVRAGAHDLEIPEPDYVLTLDADSIVLPEYALRLVHAMEQPGNERVAIVQTPYSAYRNAPTRIERMAGATTDLQYIAHLGMTCYGATSWVGANAVIRKCALDDIVEEGDEGGFPVRRYIQDRTVIEDTESTLDLRLAGWQLVNVPERLDYSATPPDFGALCVQGQRWANGGLLSLGKLRALMRRQDDRSRTMRAAEWLLRLNYLASLAWATLGLLVLLAYPFDQRLLTSYALLTALPYFVAMATDLRRTGYRRTDVLRLYGFNLLLLPVNASGALKSILQGIGGQRIAFARTPRSRRAPSHPPSSA